MKKYMLSIMCALIPTAVFAAGAGAGAVSSLDEMEKTKSAVLLQAEKDTIAALGKHYNLTSEDQEKDWKEREEEQVQEKLFEEIIEDGSFLEVLEQDIKWGITESHAPQQALIKKALKDILRTPDEDIEKMWQAGRAYFKARLAAIPDTIKNAYPHGSEKRKKAIEAFMASDPEYKATIAKLKADWRKIAEPLVVLYYTIYYKYFGKLNAMDDLIIPESATHPQSLTNFPQ